MDSLHEASLASVATQARLAPNGKARWGGKAKIGERVKL